MCGSVDPADRIAFEKPVQLGDPFKIVYFSHKESDGNP
jgi:hypothetical protein